VVVVVVVVMVVVAAAAAVVVVTEVGCGGLMRSSRTHVIDLLPSNFVTIPTLYICGFRLFELMRFKNAVLTGRLRNLWCLVYV
jgi:hypothetical protein